MLGNKIKNYQAEILIKSMYAFKAKIELIGINPFVFVPDKILNNIFIEAGKSKGHLPIMGTVNGRAYKQTLVKYNNEWRLYINTTMLKDSPKKIGEVIAVTIAFDPAERTISPPPKLIKALKETPAAKNVFEKLPASRQKEIVRYISNLKTEESVDKNIKKAIQFLQGKTRFIGRDKPF